MKEKNVVGIVAGSLILGGALGAGSMLALKRKSADTGGICSISGGSSQQGIFSLDGNVYSANDLPDEGKDHLFQIQNQAYEGTLNFSKELALRISLAQEKDKNVDVKKLPPMRELLAVGDVSDEEAKKFFEANKANLPPGTKLEDVRPQLEQYLANQRVGEQSRSKLQELLDSGRMKLLVSPPSAPVVQLDLAGYPAKGNLTGGVTVVEISDYMCPHCRTMKPEMEKILSNKKNVKFVQINYALNPAGLSGSLARGAHCAQQENQESFWKYHDGAFKVPSAALKSKTPDEEAIKVAQGSGLNLEPFKACLGSPEAAKAIADTNAAMQNYGISGTPTFFVNNRRVVPNGTDSFPAVIEKAIANAD